MASLTRNNVLTADFAYQGSPFILIAAQPAVNLFTLDYACNGSPFVSNCLGSAVAHHIKRTNTVLFWSAVKKFGGKVVSSIKTINSTET